MSSLSTDGTDTRSSPRISSHRKRPSDSGSQCLDLDDPVSSDVDEDDEDWSGEVLGSEGRTSRPVLE